MREVETVMTHGVIKVKFKAPIMDQKVDMICTPDSLLTPQAPRGDLGSIQESSCSRLLQSLDAGRGETRLWAIRTVTIIEDTALTSS